MKSLNFSTGIYREYAINGDESNTIRVNIADTNLFKRFSEVEAEARATFESLKSSHDAAALIEADAKLRGMLDHVFGAGLSDKVFGTANALSPTEDGGTLFTGFCEAFGRLLAEDSEAFRRERTAEKPAVSQRVQKYLPEGSAALAKPIAPQVPDVSGLTSEQKKALLAQLLA